MKLLVRLSLLTSLFAFISLGASAQCTQKIPDLPAVPELLGFRLGMTKEQVKALVPQTKFGRTDDFGVSKTTINPFFDSTIDKTKFVSVRSVSLDFLDEQLTSIWIGYDETYKVQVVDEFASAASQSLKLPNAWSPWKGRGKQMRCDGFQLTVSTVAGGPSFRLLDLSADDTIAERRAAKEERDAAAETAAESGPTEDAAVAADNKTKTYYPNGCEAAKTISGDNLVVFKTAEEAEKAGFKIAKGCN
jgi:hypothetical protein